MRRAALCLRPRASRWEAAARIQTNRGKSKLPALRLAIIAKRAVANSLAALSTHANLRVAGKSKAKGAASEGKAVGSKKKKRKGGGKKGKKKKES